MTAQTVFLCEKPDQGRIVAKAIGVVRSGDGFIECVGNTTVTWCFGHLMMPKMPEDYDEQLKSWSWSTLPIMPAPFEFKPRNGGAAKQLRTIGGLLKGAHEAVVATDADREGELIAYLVLNQLRWKGPVQRLWISDLTLPAVKKALSSLKPGAETKPLYHAALARTCSDWVVGMNLSRAATLRLRQGPGKPISIGRVQTPTLALIVRLERKILNFKPQNYFELVADLLSDGGHALSLRHAPPPEKRIFDRPTAEALAARARGAHGPLAVKTEAKTQAPPPLFDINLLQQEANARFGWSADRTLKVAQSLYETHQYLTYPRTDSTALPEEHKTNIPTILRNLLALADLKHLAPALSKPVVRTSVYDDGKVTAHHAIVPTLQAADLARLNDDERRLYMLVARTYLAAHMEDHRYLATTIEFDANGVPFRTAGRQPTFAGWKDAFSGVPNQEEEEKKTGSDGTEDGDDQATIKLPPVKDGEKATVRDVKVETKTTQPPKRFTEKSLLKAMQNIAQYVDDPHAKKRLRQTSGIGTGATRAGIIETLKERDYIRVTKRQIAPTDTGMGVIDAMEAACPDYCDPAQTAAWEDVLEDISLNKAQVSQFVEAIAAKVKTDVVVLRDKADLRQIGSGEPGRPTHAEARARSSGGARFASSPQRREALAKGTPLRVAYDAREKAKGLGALWDGDRKLWIAPPGADLDSFRKAGFLA